MRARAVTTSLPLPTAGAPALARQTYSARTRAGAMPEELLPGLVADESEVVEVEARQAESAGPSAPSAVAETRVRVHTLTARNHARTLSVIYALVCVCVRMRRQHSQHACPRRRSLQLALFVRQALVPTAPKQPRSILSVDRSSNRGSLRVGGARFADDLGADDTTTPRNPPPGTPLRSPQ